jgi:hypothetical protein
MKHTIPTTDDTFASIVELLSFPPENDDILRFPHGNGQSCILVWRNILTAAISLAMDSKWCVLLSLYGEGIFVQLVEKHLIETSDETVRKRASRALRLLVSNSISGPLIANSHLCMIQRLQMCLRDQNGPIRAEVSHVVLRLSKHIQSPSVHHLCVLQALEFLVNEFCALSQSRTRSTIHCDVLARAIRDHAAFVQNRIPMCHRRSLVDGIAQLIIAPSATSFAKTMVCEALLDLTKETNNLVLVGTSTVIAALIEEADQRTNMREFAEGQQWRDKRRELAVQILLRFITVAESRQKLICLSKVVPLLLGFAAESVCKKDETKQAALLLLREM